VLNLSSRKGALVAAKRALARNPNLSFSADIHDLLAWSHSELGREKDARVAVGEILKLFPN
jgi:hypothetical protein